MKDKIDVMYKGLLIGATMLVPGVSGASMAMILGIYKRLLAAVSSFSQNKKENLGFLLLFAGSAVVGMLLLARPILSLLEAYPKPMQCFFIGAVSGGIPVIWKQAQVKKASWKYSIYIAAGLLLTAGISKLPTGILSVPGICSSESLWEEKVLTCMKGDVLSSVFLIVVGMIAATALVLPGISISYFLLIMGLYQELMLAISVLDMSFLVPMGIGVLSGILLVTKGLEHILDKYPQAAYLTILGFVIGSVIEILPALPQGREWILCILAAMAGCFLIANLSEA